MAPPFFKGRAVSFSPKIDGEMGRWGDGENFGLILGILGKFIVPLHQGR
ncbi:MAG: hypothetical protein F6J98_31375 [Moorea sp. SIO4G2]|nr:hypothetical protein [Moorena sp. SIO4G2]